MSTSKEIQEAVAAERKAAKRLDLSGRQPYFVVSLILFLMFLGLSYTQGVRGYELFLGGTGVSPMELVFVYATAVAMVGTVITLVTKRTEVGWISWMFSGFAFFVAIWAFWALGFAGGASAGFFVVVMADLLALIGFSLVSMRKSPEQLAAQERVRQVAGQLDEVGGVQDQFAKARKAQFAAENGSEILADDRRAQAAARYRHQQEQLAERKAQKQPPPQSAAPQAEKE